MNKVTKQVQAQSTMPQKNVINSIMSFLPDNRPITSLQIVEDFEKCPKNFTTVHRTYDQDSDADLWRETIIFGRQTTRYLCLSKTEGLPEYVLETLRVISEKELPPKEFSLLSRTADTEQKAWRKRQIAYKLSKRSSVTHAVTDIILCSKLKTAPEGFKLAGDINGILVCFKTGVLYIRFPSTVLQQKAEFDSETNDEVEQAFNRLNINRRSNQPLPPVPQPYDNDYEEIQSSYQISPMRSVPKPPAIVGAASSTYYIGTLGAYSELEGVPFSLHPKLKPNDQIASVPIITESVCDLDYDFQLERHILCTMKSSASKNPFFQ